MSTQEDSKECQSLLDGKISEIGIMPLYGMGFLGNLEREVLLTKQTGGQIVS